MSAAVTCLVNTKCADTVSFNTRSNSPSGCSDRMPARRGSQGRPHRALHATHCTVSADALTPLPEVAKGGHRVVNLAAVPGHHLLQERSAALLLADVHHVREQLVLRQPCGTSDASAGLPVDGSGSERCLASGTLHGAGPCTAARATQPTFAVLQQAVHLRLRAQRAHHHRALLEQLLHNPCSNRQARVCVGRRQGKRVPCPIAKARATTSRLTSDDTQPASQALVVAFAVGGGVPPGGGELVHSGHVYVTIEGLRMTLK